MSTYDLPDELQVRSDGPVRVVTLNRPDDLNATNHVLHAGLAALFPQLDADAEARVAVITGAGRAFSAGGDFDYLDELTKDAELRHTTLAHGRQIVTGMVACRLPIIAAVNGPAVGLGCSLVALSDIVFMAESAHLADPHVLLGLVAADGGPVVWPLLTSLQLAKEYALTGDRIPAERAAEIGLVNHVCPDDEVLSEAMACAQRIAKLPKGAVEDTKRIINIQMERAVLAALDFALRRRTARSRRRSSGPTSTGRSRRGATRRRSRDRLDAVRRARRRPGAAPPGRPTSHRVLRRRTARGLRRWHGRPARRRRVMASSSAACSSLAALLRFGEELEVVARHDADRLAQVGEQAG